MGNEDESTPIEENEEEEDGEQGGETVKKGGHYFWMLSRRNGGFNERELALILRVHYQPLTGASEYKLNDKTATYSAYNASSISHNTLVKAKSFSCVSSRCGSHRISITSQTLSSYK
jgi:hypothetical protein